MVAVGHDFGRVLALVTRGEVQRRFTLLELPKINPKSARKCRRGPSSALNGPQADPQRPRSEFIVCFNQSPEVIPAAWAAANSVNKYDNRLFFIVNHDGSLTFQIMVDNKEKTSWSASSFRDGNLVQMQSFSLSPSPVS